MNEPLLAVLPDPSMLLTPDGMVVSANAAAAEFLHSTVDDLKGRSIYGLVTEPESIAGHFLEIASRTRSTVPGALTWKLDEGALVETRCDAALVEAAADGQPAVVYLRWRPKKEALAGFRVLNEQIRALSKEIQERRKAEAALRRSEERYRTLVASTSNVVYTADRTGQFDGPQPSWAAFTGQTDEEYRALGGLDAIHPDDRRRVQEIWAHSLETGQRFDCEMRLWHAASQCYHECISTAAPVRSAGGEIREWIGTITDVDDRKRLEEQLRQTQKLESLGVLAGGVAHDFNNLLVGILGNASLALEDVPPDSAMHALLRDVVAASETAAHLTKQLLAYAGKGRFVVEPVDLSELVRQIGVLVQASIPKTVQLRLELQNGLLPVEADLAQLQQLIMNLVINGAEAIPEGSAGVVTVVTGEQEVVADSTEGSFTPEEILPGRYVSLEVSDTGTGMTADVMLRIFDPFFTTKFAGRGLGLAAALGIVRGHKGAIQVRSTPGEGSTFRVLFPAMEQPLQAAAETIVDAQRRGSEKVLVIDDEIVVRRTAKTMLERLGYAVMVADNGEEGVELFRSQADQVSVVLLDMTMPVMSGEETFRRLKEIRSDVLVILSSGYNEVEAIRRFTGEGLAGFLQKPYNGAALQQKVRGVIDEARRQRERARLAS